VVPIEELLKSKVVKISFAEVAEYLLQVIAEKYAQEQTHSAAPSEDATMPADNPEGVEGGRK
jgi:hypothetical protein